MTVCSMYISTDLQIGSYLDQDPESCNRLCPEGNDCCDEKAQCTCGTTSGHYACLCSKGFYGTGLKGDCHGIIITWLILQSAFIIKIDWETWDKSS